MMPKKIKKILPNLPFSSCRNFSSACQSFSRFNIILYFQKRSEKITMATTTTVTPLKDICIPLPPPEQTNTLLVNVLLPVNENDDLNDEDKKPKPSSSSSSSPSSPPLYRRCDVLLQEGKIAAIEPPHSIQVKDSDDTTTTTTTSKTIVVDGSEKMLLPGFVNGHTHSVEHWLRGLIQPLPLELWLLALQTHEPRGVKGWYSTNSFDATPASAFSLSALHCGLECLLSGCTAIMDHPFVRHIEDVEAIVMAYKALGIRAFVAPMLGDDANMNENYIPLVPDAQARNTHFQQDTSSPSSSCCSCGGMAANGMFRTTQGPSDPIRRQQIVELWEESVKRFHDPENGINIVIGPVAVHSCSMELLQEATRLRRKYNLCGHTHLLETRAQALIAKQAFPSQSAVKQLQDSGFLDIPGTSCAHTVWLTDEEYDIMAKAGAVCVHNPLSNTRLGSGIMPVQKALHKSVVVAMGCDGTCSSDGQDVLEALKMATLVSSLTTGEYREWLRPKEVAMTMASKNGYIGLNMAGQAGELKVGQQADLTLWDLTALSMLPRTDPINLLVLGSRCQAPGAGSALHTVWVRGRPIVQNGSPTGVDIPKLRQALMGAQPDYRNPDDTDPRKDVVLAPAENEYRAAMGLDTENQKEVTSEELGSMPDGRVLYCSTIP